MFVQGKPPLWHSRQDDALPAAATPASALVGPSPARDDEIDEDFSVGKVAKVEDC